MELSQYTIIKEFIIFEESYKSNVYTDCKLRKKFSTNFNLCEIGRSRRTIGMQQNDGRQPSHPQHRGSGKLPAASQALTNSRQRTAGWCMPAISKSFWRTYSK